MKKNYIFILVMLAFSQLMMAQLTLTQANNGPTIGDKWDSNEYDSLSVVIPKSTGTSQTWNFNTLTINSNTETATYTTAVSTPSGAAYPASNIAYSRGTNGSADYYKSSTNKLEILGFVDISNNNKVVFSAPGPWYVWPISYGSTTSATFAATETNGTNTAAWTGTVSYLASGSGTVILPGGNVHNNCLQYRRVIDINTTGAYTSQMHMVQYEYFSSSRKLPILKIEYQSVTSGTNISKSIWITADKGALNVGVSEIPSLANEFMVFPNPTKDVINIQLPNNAVAESLEIVDVVGKVATQTFNTNSINLTGLTKGIYFVRVINKEFVLQKPIVLID